MVQHGSAPASGATVTVVEYYHSTLDHWFITSLDAEIAALDRGDFPGWTRSGKSFRAYRDAQPRASPVCRFYLLPPQNSHFYSASPAECAAVATQYPAFVAESPRVFHIGLPNTATGECPATTTPVYRLYNNRPDTNHRYAIDPAIKAQMQARGYIAEGYGADAAAMCAP